MWLPPHTCAQKKTMKWHFTWGCILASQNHLTSVTRSHTHCIAVRLTSPQTPLWLFSLRGLGNSSMEFPYWICKSWEDTLFQEHRIARCKSSGSISPFLSAVMDKKAFQNEDTQAGRQTERFYLRPVDLVGMKDRPLMQKVTPQSDKRIQKHKYMWKNINL